MSWISLLDDAQFLLSLYPDSVPSLEGAVLHEVKMLREGSVVSLRFDLPDFPANPPSNWRTQHFNVAQVTMMGIGVRRLVQMDGVAIPPSPSRSRQRLAASQFVRWALALNLRPHSTMSEWTAYPHT